MSDNIKQKNNYYTIERAEQIFENENYKLISTEYKYNTKLKYTCNNGHDGAILLKNFIYGQRCKNVIY